MAETTMAAVKFVDARKEKEGREKKMAGCRNDASAIRRHRAEGYADDVISSWGSRGIPRPIEMPLE